MTDDIGTVATELLDALAALAPAEPPRPRHRAPAPSGWPEGRLDVEKYLTAKGVGYTPAAPWKDGATRWRLEKCPFCGHRDPDALVIQFASGATTFKCSHNSCAGCDWESFKAKVGEPDGEHYDPPRGPKAEPSVPADVTPAPRPWPDPPGDEAFYGLAGRIVGAIDPTTEADRAGVLVQLLVAFGNVVGRGPYFEVEVTRHHCNEFVVTVGDSAKGRKGVAWNRVRHLFAGGAPFAGVDPDWLKWRVQSGACSGEGLIWAVRDPIVKRERVKERGEPVQYVEVEVDPGIADKRLLDLEFEFSAILKQSERTGNTLTTTLRDAWDGVDLNTGAKNNPCHATGPHISSVAHTTEADLKKYLTETDMANGFANRYLYACVKRSKLLPDGGAVDPAVMAPLAAELAAAVASAKAAGQVRRDDGARAIWHAVYGPLSEGKPGLAGSILARSEAHVLRLSMIYALLDRSRLIRAEHLLAALALWDYCERSVYFLFGDSLGDSIADDLLRLLRGCPAGMTRTEISNYFQRHTSTDRLNRALGVLLQHKLARMERCDTGGRTAERWFATGQHLKV
jgi:hypothetical protein